jgi:uncharacterized short protein YbdD (DUF466 family)
VTGNPGATGPSRGPVAHLAADPTAPGPIRRALAGLRWYLREATGEAKWDAYVDDCSRRGETPMSRREFERHRSDHREANPQSRCC